MSRPTPSADIAARLKQARLVIFPSAAAAAEALGMNPVTLRTHEAGTRGISFYDLDRYSRRYGVSFEWLVTGKGQREPSAEVRMQYGELVSIVGVLEDGKMHKGTLDDDRIPGWGPLPFGAGDFETTIYDDPRFPEDLIQAFRVKTRREDGPYIDGTVVFAVPAYSLGIREGDHVIIVRSVGGETEWTLRQACLKDTYKSLLSDADDIIVGQEVEGEERMYYAIVTSYSGRRPVPPLPLQDRIEHERAETFWRKQHKNAT